jgi:hypothetical protein
MGRVIDFTSTGTTYKKLTSMKVKTATGSYVYYYYGVDEFPSGYHRLASFAPPLVPATTYEYLVGTNNQYELIKATTSDGGQLEYCYANHLFYFGSTGVTSRVVSQKKITFNPGEHKVWNFAYPSYNGTTTGTTTVEGPEFSTFVTNNGYNASCPWKIGLIDSKTLSDGSFTENFDWTYEQISNLYWVVLGADMGTAKGPLLAFVNQVPLGDATSKTEYLYEREETKKYGLPTRINLYYNGATNPRTYTELTFFYESSTYFQDRYMLAYVSDKIDRAGDGAMLKRAAISYYQEAGKWGAIDEVRMYTTESEYRTWDYSYLCYSPSSIKITIDPPGEPGPQKYIALWGSERAYLFRRNRRYSLEISQYDALSYLRRTSIAESLPFPTTAPEG